MKRIAYLLFLCLFGVILLSGCLDPDTQPSVGTYYASKDPGACKSIEVVCPDRSDANARYVKFSDETGCGCRWEKT
jgi:hypothetical protein